MSLVSIQHSRSASALPLGPWLGSKGGRICRCVVGWTGWTLRDHQLGVGWELLLLLRFFHQQTGETAAASAVCVPLGHRALPSGHVQAQEQPLVWHSTLQVAFLASTLG